MREHDALMAIASLLMITVDSHAMPSPLSRISSPQYSLQQGKVIMDTNNMSANNGIISQPSPYSVTETIDRLVAVLQAKGINIFGRIDQKAEAEKAGLSLLPTQLLLFGNPKAGTPLMMAEPTIALDLPLKILAWEAPDEKVWLSYNTPNYLMQRFSLPNELVKNIDVITSLIYQALL